MNIDKLLTDESILIEIGKRISRKRLELNLTQSKLAFESGVSKRTIERMEKGTSIQLTNFIRILRKLDLLNGLNELLPVEEIPPMELVKTNKRGRKRASSVKNNKNQNEWSWDDES